MSREVWITGYGLLSPLGETPEAWLPRLDDPGGLRGNADTETCKPFPIYQIGDHELAAQVPKPGDQRAMGPMMQYGAYAAGLALDMAGIKGDESLLLGTHLLAAAGGGERDWDLDEEILAKLETTNDRQALLNRELSDGLRPTLFLAQLPNLFAGNISIIHGVSGSSRTFMGEEAAGVDTVRIGFQKIAAGQGDIFLIGAAFSALRPDLLQLYHTGGTLLTGEVTGLWQRPDAGMCVGSSGAFFVLESRDSAERRGAAPRAVLKGVHSHRTARAPGAASAVATAQWDALRPAIGEGPLALLSGASGAGPITAEEMRFLEGLAEGGMQPAVRGTAAALGHAMEASFLQNLILAVSCLERGEVFGPLAPDVELEARVGRAPVQQAIITGWGHMKGEGMALLEKANVT